MIDYEKEEDEEEKPEEPKGLNVNLAKFIFRAVSAAGYGDMKNASSSSS